LAENKTADGSKEELDRSDTRWRQPLRLGLAFRLSL